MLPRCYCFSWLLFSPHFTNSVTRLIFLLSSDVINMWFLLFVSYSPLRCLLSLGFMVVVASLEVWPVYSLPTAYCRFKGLYFLMRITESHSEICGM